MGGKSTTSTTTNTPPPEVMAAYKDLLAKANPVASTPYQPYMGGVNGTGMEQNQITGFNSIAGLNGSSNGSFDSASGALDAAGVPTSASVGQYMSPYITGVVNSTMANMNEMNGQQQQGVLGNAIAQGAMGGNRVGVAQGELARQQNLANQQTIAGLYNGAYTNALGAAQADKQANLQAGSEYANLGQTQMQTNLGQAAAQVGAGTQQQQYNYQQYQNKQSYPFQTTSWLANIVEGLGGQMGGTSSTTQPAGNTGSGILGGLLGLGSLFLNRGGVVSEDRLRRATGGVIPYSSPSGIVSANDNSQPAANDNGYVPAAATDTTGHTNMPTSSGVAPQQASDPMLQQGMKGMEGALKAKYPNGILAGLNTVALPSTAPIPTPSPMTGEAGLPARTGDVAAPASGLLSGLSSLLGFADGGVARKGYDNGGAVLGDDPLLDNIRALLGKTDAAPVAPAPLPDAQFDARTGPAPLQDANFNARTGVVPVSSANMGVDLPSISNTPVVTSPLTPDAFAGSTASAAPATHQSRAPQGAGSPGEIRRGQDGQTYQYAETTGMAGATGDSGWIPVNAGASAGVVSPSGQAADGSGVVPPLPPAKTVNDFPVKDVPMAPGDYFGQGVDVNRLPAGMRNNNPGNIKFVGQKVPGIIGPSQNTDQGDPQAVFDSPYAGMKAAADLALRKNVHGAATIGQLIAGNGGWTPGNKQAAANIANTMGVSPDTPVDLAQPSQMKNFLRGLVTQEHGPAGKLYSDDLIASAVDGITVPTSGTGTAYNGAATPSATPASSALTALAGGDEPSTAPVGATGVVSKPDDPRGIISSIFHGERPNISNDMRMTLLSAGLGMMASKSPNMLTGIGEGGEKGMETWMQKQALNRENAQAASEIATRAGNLGLEGKRVDIAGQDLALKAKTTAADIAKTTADTARTGVETAGERYQTQYTPAGLMVRDVTRPDLPPHIISYSDLQNGALMPDGSPVPSPGATPPAPAGASPAAAPAAAVQPQRAPVTAAPVQPVGPVPVGTQQPQAQAGQIFTTEAPSRIPIDPRMMQPAGGVGPSTVVPETTDALHQARTNYQAATTMQTQLGEMQHDLAALPASAMTKQGSGFNTRVQIAKTINTAMQMAGVQPLFDEKAVAAGEDLNKQTTKLGFSLSSTLGSGEAASIVEKSVASVPGGANSPEGARRIIAGIQAGNQRNMDYYQFLQDWAGKSGGSIRGADQYFNSHNPPELYAIASYVPAGAIQALRQHPDQAANFEQKYGAGTSKYVLTGQ